jgi:hypothetical protein
MTGVRRFISAGVLLFLAAARVPAQDNYTVKRLAFLPQDFYVGDEVELRMEIQLDGDMRIAVPEGKLPADEWVEITRIKPPDRKGQDCTLSIFFVTYHTGKNTLPEVKLQDITVRNVVAETKSILERKNIDKLQPSRGQVELPDSYLKIGVNIVLSILIPALVFFLSLILLREAKRFAKNRKLELPHRKLKNGCARLLKKADSMDPKSFFIALTELVKEYFSLRLLIPALCLTTSDLGEFLGCGIFGEEINAGIVAVLKKTDDVKFAGRPTTGEEMRGVVGEILSLVDRIEERKEAEGVEP